MLTVRLAAQAVGLLRNRSPFCQPVVAAAIAAYPKEEQTVMTIVLIYTSGFLAVVATALVAMIKTITRPNR
ncbi:hypothetical protein [Paraburkholderia sp. RL17-337-BIB-A]|uniref:hypothetical protein n=1 Tax=Paraburkholderia sp. RL17-337-BIB-A TaxID=3031636 RepID=UPI0038BD1650